MSRGALSCVVLFAVALCAQALSDDAHNSREVLAQVVADASVEDFEGVGRMLLAGGSATGGTRNKAKPGSHNIANGGTVVSSGNGNGQGGSNNGGEVQGGAAGNGGSAGTGGAGGIPARKLLAEHLADAGADQVSRMLRAGNANGSNGNKANGGSVGQANGGVATSSGQGNGGPGSNGGNRNGAKGNGGKTGNGVSAGNGGTGGTSIIP